MTQSGKVSKRASVKKSGTSKATAPTKSSKSSKPRKVVTKKLNPTEEADEDDDYVTVVTARKAMPKSRDYVSGLFEVPNTNFSQRHTSYTDGDYVIYVDGDGHRNLREIPKSHLPIGGDSYDDTNRMLLTRRERNNIFFDGMLAGACFAAAFLIWSCRK